jgi:hypothetical protein
MTEKERKLSTTAIMKKLDKNIPLHNFKLPITAIINFNKIR